MFYYNTPPLTVSGPHNSKSPIQFKRSASLVQIYWPDQKKKGSLFLREEAKTRIQKSWVQVPIQSLTCRAAESRDLHLSHFFHVSKWGGCIRSNEIIYQYSSQIWNAKKALPLTRARVCFLKLCYTNISLCDSVFLPVKWE